MSYYTHYRPKAKYSNHEKHALKWQVARDFAEINIYGHKLLKTARKRLETLTSVFQNAHGFLGAQITTSHYRTKFLTAQNVLENIQTIVPLQITTLEEVRKELDEATDGLELLLNTSDNAQEINVLAQKVYELFSEYYEGFGMMDMTLSETSVALSTNPDWKSELTY